MAFRQGRATPRSRNVGVEVGVESRLSTPTLKIFKSTPDSDSKILKIDSRLPDSDSKYFCTTI